MAYLRIKTNINKLVFTAHADPAVINATINIFQSFPDKIKCAWTLFFLIYFHAVLSLSHVCLFVLILTFWRYLWQRCSRDLTQNLDNLCDRLLPFFDIKFQTQKFIAREFSKPVAFQSLIAWKNHCRAITKNYERFSPRVVGLSWKIVLHDN